jgi:BirA family transcriptional regulator, biotin operon repressor / biotin---[acetyl-CoA-carboxylase] ligase
VRVGRQKIAGVLVESRDRSAVFGVGLNVNTDASDFPPELRDQAGSLRSLTGRTYDRSQIAQDLLRHLDRYLGYVDTDQEHLLWSTWMSFADFAGCRAVVKISGNRHLSGRIVDFSPPAGLVFDPDAGAPCQIHPSRIVEVRY